MEKCVKKREKKKDQHPVTKNTIRNIFLYFNVVTDKTSKHDIEECLCLK